MKKTEFMELWSEINYTNHFDSSKITFYFEDRMGLKPLKLNDIISKQGKMFTIRKSSESDIHSSMEIVEIPEYRIWVVQYGKILLYDNRSNYTGKKDLSLHNQLVDSNDFDSYQPLLNAITNYGWNIHSVTNRLLANINYVKKEDLTLYNYNDRVLVPRDHPILVKCRGIVITDDGIIVNYPFNRFFNHFEREHDLIDWDSALLHEKLDGSLICIFFHRNKWYITTRGAFYPLPRRENEIFEFADMNFEELFKKHFHRFDKLKKDHCYMFELVTKENVIVTHYEEEFVALLGIRNMNTLKEIPPDSSIARMPRTFSVMDLDNALSLFNRLKDDEEGLIAVDKDYNRIKLKQESYFLLSKIKMLKPNELFEYILGKIELDAEFLQRDENIMRELVLIRKHWEDVKKQIDETFAKINNLKERKDFALEAIKYPYKNVLFSMLDDRDYINYLTWDKVRNW